MLEIIVTVVLAYIPPAYICHHVFTVGHVEKIHKDYAP